jgi:hypothetical protein
VGEVEHAAVGFFAVVVDVFEVAIVEGVYVEADSAFKG